jgi:1-acyl-sn-glycerol-3-phosphate acyltransferase
MVEAKSLYRQWRRLWRLACLLAHVLVGVLAAHALFALLAATRTDPRGRRRHAVVRWWCRGVLRIIGVRLTHRGEIARGAVLYTANHVSWLDIPCLGAFLDAAFVSKADVLRWPVIGALARQAGTIFLRRGEADASAHTADRMTWTLTARRGVIVFPEGTTTDGRRTAHFHARLYQAATRTDSMTQAIAIRYPHPERPDEVHPRAPFIGDDALAGHLWKLLGEDTIAVTLHYCAPVAPAGMSRRALAEHTRAQIQALLPAGGVSPVSAADGQSVAR